MAEQYWIGGFFIDLPRNQITQNEQSQTVAPKALAVLTYLAQNQGKVVSQDELLEHVWQGTVVSSNTLQRSIAQLRKILGDDSKAQLYIKTHAKKGYSLECDVRWHNTPVSTSPEPVAAQQLPFDDSTAQSAAAVKHNHDNTPAAKATKSAKFVSAVIAIIVVALLGFFTFKTDLPSQLSFGEIQPLTATDAKELASIYSPDGKYIIFHRYSNKECVNGIWAKNIATQKEHKLTKNLDIYGKHSFSKDGKQLVFIRTLNCGEPITQKKCYQLMSMDFIKALDSPQPMQLLLECKNSEIRDPHWVNDNTIALLQKESDRWQLINYSISDNKSQVVYTVDDGNIIHYDYSVKDNVIALVSVRANGQYYIEILKPDGQVISSNPIIYPQEIAKFRLIRPSFSSLENQLVFSTGKQLFTLSYDGQIASVRLPVDEPIWSPVFHPNGRKMLVIKGHYDSDITAISLTQLAQRKTPLNSDNIVTIERSILEDSGAIFAPTGSLIAFESERSGQEQIWLTDQQETRQLSRFPTDTRLFEFDWAADGQSILANVDGQLILVPLAGSEKPFSFNDSVIKLFDWDSDAQRAVVSMRIKGVATFVELNLADQTKRIINDKKVKWAARSANNQLVYTDQLDRFWQPGPVEDTLIEALAGQGSDKAFLIEDDMIYGVNEDHQLWSYDLIADQFKLIGNLTKNVDAITDVKNEQLLMTTRITAKKEVVELSLRE